MYLHAPYVDYLLNFFFAIIAIIIEAKKLKECINVSQYEKFTPPLHTTVSIFSFKDIL